MKITIDMSNGAYKIAKKVYSGEMTRTEAKMKINQVTGMNEVSAQAFVTIFLSMISGEKYKRAGPDAYKNALSAVQKHINYYSTLGKGNLKSLQDIVDELLLSVK